MGEAVLKIRTEGGADVAKLLADVERLVDASARRVGASRRRRAQESQQASQQEIIGYRQSAAVAVEQDRAISRSRLRELALQGDAQKRFQDLFADAQRRATTIVEAETGNRGSLSEKERRTADRLALAMVASHEQAERRKTEATRRESKRRETIAREAAAAVADTASRVHSATQAPRQEAAQINATLAGAFGEGGASAAELGGMTARVWQFAQQQGMDPEQLARSLQASQQQFSSLSGASPAARNAAMERSLAAAQLAHDTQSDPEQVMRLSGALGGLGSQDTINTVLRSAIGISRRGGVELGSLSAQNLGTIQAQMAAAVANLRRTNPRASESEAQGVMVDAFTETLSQLEVLAPRGLEGRRAGTAVRQLGSALHDPRTQAALLTRVRGEFGRGSAQESQLFDANGRMLERFMGANGGEEFGRAITGIAGNDPDRIRSLLGRGQRTGDRGEVLHANQRDMIAALAGQDAQGRTGWDAMRVMRQGATDVTPDDIARTRAIVQGLDATSLTRTRVAGMTSARAPGMVTEASDAAADFAARNPILSTLLGGKGAQMLYQRGAQMLGRSGAARVATGAGAVLGGAAALPALAVGGAVLGYSSDSIVGGDDEAAMLRQYRTRRAISRPASAPSSAAAAPVESRSVELSDRSIQQLAAAITANPPQLSQHDAAHAATVAQSQRGAQQ